jgi:kinesin family protein 13
MNIKIQVDNRESGYKYFWDLAKFSNRYYIIKDMI